MNGLDAPNTITIGLDSNQAAAIAQLCSALAAISAVPGAVVPGGLEAGLQAIPAIAAMAQSGAGLPVGEWTASFTPMLEVGRSLLAIAGPLDQIHVQLDSAAMPFAGTWQGNAGVLTFTVEGGSFCTLAPMETVIPIGPISGWAPAPQFISPGDDSEGALGFGAGALFAAGGILVAAAGALLARKRSAPAAPPAPAAQAAPAQSTCRNCGAVWQGAARFCGVCGKPV